MAQNFKLYEDSTLTQVFDPATQTLKVSPGQSPKDFSLYFGSTDAALKVQADSNPGVDQITVSPNDTNPGVGHETSAVKLALTQGGLGAAGAGASLDLGSEIQGGVANAVQFWVRMTDATGETVSSTDLYLACVPLLEGPV